MSTRGIIAFDCDSTLSGIEGIDELARIKGESTFAEIESLTHQAMDGTIAIDDIFAQRLEIIQPTISDCKAVAQLYLENIETEALFTIQNLQTSGWETIIISGGFTQIIQPLAVHLGISSIHAVPLIFNDDGTYAGFDTSAPPTRNGGKPEILAKLKNDLQPEKIIMVGDGISDLETRSVADCFIGFGRYVTRKKVKQDADYFITSLDELPSIAASI